VQRELERRVLLSVLDRKWREHLYEMDYLQEGIGLRAMAQRDPLVEYQREGFDMFAAMMDAVKEESVGFLFNLDVEVSEDGEAGSAPTIVTSAPAPAVEAPADEPSADDEAEASGPKLDVSLLKAAQDEHEAGANGGTPQIRAKGLDRGAGKERPLTYSAPELGSDGPSVKTTTDDDKSSSATARRQQARSNPNRGSRGNKGGAKSKRKR
jgi:preprotein translocase subunit SecA